MAAKKKIIAAYLRCSTDDQSHESQRAEVEACIEREGIDPEAVRWFIDTGTGDNLEREAYEELDGLIMRGKVGTVIVARLDRLSRDMADGVALIARWLDEGGVRFISATQGFDFKGTVGKMVAAMLLGFAEIEQQTRRERQRAGIEAAKKRGVYKGRRKGQMKKGVNPKRAAKLRAKGCTWKETAAALGVSIPTARRYVERYG